ncbi:hypothetical protein, partial [Micromonospora sonneratiae]
MEKRPGNIVAKGIQPNQSRRTSLAGVSKTWHWLIKHPVEFSKNKHTPSNKPAQQARHPGLSF